MQTIRIMQNIRIPIRKERGTENMELAYQKLEQNLIDHSGGRTWMYFGKIVGNL